VDTEKQALMQLTSDPLQLHLSFCSVWFHLWGKD